MKIRQKCSALLLALSLTIILLIAVPQNFVIAEAATTVRLNKTKLELDVHESEPLKLIGTKEKVEWFSNKMSVAIVSEEGVVKAQGDGTAIITARVNNKKYYCKVTIKKPVTYEIITTDEKSIIVVKNNTHYGAYIEADTSYFDEKGRIVYGYRSYLDNIGAGKKTVIVFVKPVDEKTNKPMKNIKLGIISYVSKRADTPTYAMTDKVKSTIHNFNDSEVNFSLSSDKLKGDYYVTGNAVFYKGKEISAVIPFYCDKATFGNAETYDLSLQLADKNTYYYKPTAGVDRVEINISSITRF